MWQWRFSPSSDQVRESLCYFSDIDLTRSPLLSGLDLRAPSGLLGALPSCRAAGGISLKFEALLGLVVDELGAVGTLLLLLPAG